MTFKDTEEAQDIRNIHKKEIRMYEFYSEVYKEVRDPFLRARLRKMKKQELGHIRMVQEIIDVLRERIIEG